MSSSDHSPSKSPDHRWPTGHNGRTQRVAGQVFPSLSHSGSNKSSMTETLERLRTLSLESKAMSDSLDDVPRPEDSPTGGKPSPYSPSDHDDWMAKWHSDKAYHRTTPGTLDVKGSSSLREPLSDGSMAAQAAQSPSNSTTKLRQKIDPGFYNSDADDSPGEPSLFTSAQQYPQPHPYFTGAGFFMTPWSAPLLQRAVQKGRNPSKAEGAPFPPAYASLPNAPPQVSSSYRCQPPPPPPSFQDCCGLHGGVDTDTADLNDPKQETKCTDCADLRRELEFIRLQLAAQQSSLNRIVTELASLKTSVPLHTTGYASANSAPPPFPPWRKPHGSSWSSGRAGARPPPPLSHPSVMRLPPFPAYPYYYGPPYPPTDFTTAHPGSATFTSQIPEASPAGRTPPLPPLHTPAGTSPLTSKPQQPQVPGERNPSPKRVSFACPMTQSELDSDDSSEDTLVAKPELATKTALRPKPSKSSPLNKKAPPAIRKSSTNSSIRAKPYPMTDTLKHRPTVYSSTMPRSFYGYVHQPPRGSTHESSGSVRSEETVIRESPTSSNSSLPHSLPFIVPADEGGVSDDEGLHVRFDATTLFNFMQYWQPRADGPQPLLVDLSLDVDTYEDFLKWGCDNGSIRL